MGAIGRTQIRKALPSAEYPIVDVPLDHPMFHMLFDVKKIPQIPVDRLLGRARRPHVGARRRQRRRRTSRAINDDAAAIMVLMTHNTDFGDSFEREGDNPTYFRTSRCPATRSASTRSSTRSPTKRSDGRDLDQRAVHLKDPTPRTA